MLPEVVYPLPNGASKFFLRIAVMKRYIIYKPRARGPGMLTSLKPNDRVEIMLPWQLLTSSVVVVVVVGFFLDVYKI